MKTLYFLSFLVLMTSLNCQAQLSRIELPAKMYVEQHYTVPLGEEGFMLFSKSEEDKNKIYFKKYNSNFQEEWTVETELGDGLTYITHTYSKKSVYVLFARGSSHDYQVIRVNTVLGFISNTELFSVNNLDILFFEAYEEIAYLSGRVRNEPILLLFNLNNKQSKTISFNFEGSAEIQSMYLDSSSHVLQVVLLNQYRLRSSKLLLKAFYKDTEIQEIKLEGKDNYNLHDARFHYVSASEQYIFGTYSREFVRFPQGFFIAKTDSTGVLKYMVYKSFSDFKHFFDYEIPKYAQRLYQKSFHLLKKDKELELPYDVLLHPIYNFQDELVLYAEFIKPVYRRDFSGRTEVNTFNGWAYNHAFIASFNQQMDLSWSNCFKISDDLEQVESKQPNSITHLQFRADSSIQMSYYYNNHIHQQCIIRDSTVLKKSKEELEKYQPDAGKLRESYKLHYCTWYGYNYLLWGYQRLGPVLDKRQVYFVEKLLF